MMSSRMAKCLDAQVSGFYARNGKESMNHGHASALAAQRWAAMTESRLPPTHARLVPHANYDVVVLGAGAAGMMAAIEAGKRGRSVLVVDHAKAPGEKIRISGGGRCNFTNVNTAAATAFISQQPANSRSRR